MFLQNLVMLPFSMHLTALKYFSEPLLLNNS